MWTTSPPRSWAPAWRARRASSISTRWRANACGPTCTATRWRSTPRSSRIRRCPTSLAEHGADRLSSARAVEGRLRETAELVSDLPPPPNDRQARPRSLHLDGGGGAALHEETGAWQVIGARDHGQGRPAVLSREPADGARLSPRGRRCRVEAVHGEVTWRAAELPRRSVHLPLRGGD